MKKRILFIFGTRPEAIKVIPVIEEFRRGGRGEFSTRICVTSQHRQMLDQVLGIFRMRPDYDLDIMRKNQTLHDVTTRTLLGLRDVFAKERFDLVMVHGDTTTAFAAALAAYYARIPVGHIEAGLRSYDRYNPYPEEINRVLADALSELYFAPTALARESLLKENLPAKRVFITGNTVIDALFRAAKIPHSFKDAAVRKALDGPAGRMILVTAHRRENFGRPLRDICAALKKIVRSFPGVRVVYPVHLNPNISGPVSRALGTEKNVFLVPPVDYLDMVKLIQRSCLVLTDSGGLQEEAPSLGKPVLVMRKVTERPEGVTAGTVRLVGTSTENIVRQAGRLLSDKKEYARMSCAVNPYGDGRASGRIREAVRYYFGMRKARPKDFIPE